MAPIRSVALVLVVLVSAVGCGRPARVDPPPSGAPAEIGIAYGVEVSCPIPIELGGLWWSFEEPIEHWPPDIGAVDGDPYPVPGVLTLSSATQAVFRADSDGSEFTMTAHQENPKEGACL